MYPNLKFFVEEMFKIKATNWLGYINTFGFFVALAFLVGALLLKKELQRKEAAGLLQPELVPLSKAKKYLSKNRQVNAKQTHFPIYPHDRVGEIIAIALAGGLVGAKIFNALESWKEFVNDPIRTLFSGSGLTFYGGLIVAATLIYYYCRKHKIGMAHFCDAAAPVLMITYSIGRLGCHFSGDGDWGIFNSAYVSLPDASIRQVSLNEFDQTLTNASTYFISNFGTIENVPHASVAAPDALPRWLFAMNFPHNVINEGVGITGCTGNYCHMLPVTVFPTSLYEAIICTLLFGIIWIFRNKFKHALHLFGFYLILNGAERFFIEKIKVNYKYDWGFIHPAQSEIISVFLLISGLMILIFYKSKISRTAA